MTESHHELTDAEIMDKFKELREKACQTTNEYLVETMIVRPDNPGYTVLDQASHAANDIFNQATYQIRQSIFKNHHKSKANQTYLNYSQLVLLFHGWTKTGQSVLYKAMGNVHLAQQMLRRVEMNFSNWQKALKAYHKDPSQFEGRPKMPGYHNKQTRSFFVIDNQTARLKPNGHVWIPSFQWGYQLQHRDTKKIQEISITPIGNVFVVHTIHQTTQHSFFKRDNGRYLGIDPGLDNVMTLASNTNTKPELINGKPLKAKNQWYNKQVAYYKRQLAENSNVIPKYQPKTCNAIKQLSTNRYNYMNNYTHQLSNHIVQYAIKAECNTIIIGANKQQKRSITMGKRGNQNFVMIPHAKIVQAITFKASLYGIAVLAVNESYTSQTSFLDDERPCWANGDKSRKQQGLSPIKRRVKRGLYRANTHQLINADVNGALQIIRKVNPAAFDTVKDHGLAATLGLWPIKVTL